MQLHWKIIIGLVAGVIFGFFSSINNLGTFSTNYIAPFGTIFLNLLKLIAVPLVVSSLITGVASLSDTSKLSRIGLKTISLYLITTAIAVTIGLLLVNIIEPGNYVPDSYQEFLSEDSTSQAFDKKQQANTLKESRGPLQPLVDMVPSNALNAMSNNSNMLQVVFFSIIFGIAIIGIDKKFSQPVLSFLEGINQTIIRLVELIMNFAPFGVFALIVKTFSTISGDLGYITGILQALLIYMSVVILGLLSHVMITYTTLLKFFSNIKLKDFFSKMIPVQLVAFSTSSSGATLPVTMKRCEKDLGVNEEISSFVLPLGATINMDGTALYQGVAAVFIAQALGIDLTISNQFTIVATAVLASIGTAGVPGAGVVMLIIILEAINVPSEGIALILGVDRILDMIRTSANVTGDAAIATIIDSSEKS